jgi:Anti-sigma-K factor rskA
MTVPPEFRDLVGDELSAEERARLERVHELLVEAGPPPELPPSLAEVPGTSEQAPTWLPRRRAGAALSLAAAIALVAFLGGYVAGFRHNSFDETREVTMHGTSVAPPSARAVIKLGKQDNAGNWPMVVTVQGLPRLPESGYYELFVTRDGKFLRCGSFNVEAGSTSVDFSVPYTFERNDGWIVTRWHRGEQKPGPVLLTTT